jgi:hypothetical protein
VGSQVHQRSEAAYLRRYGPREGVGAEVQFSHRSEEAYP